MSSHKIPASSDGDSESSDESAQNSSKTPVGRTEPAGDAVKEKKKGVRFLSRLIGSKKKEILAEPKPDDLEAEDVEGGGDMRTEGTDADVFSQSIGFVPKYPVSPKYIRVRSHGKKEKDFNRLFLAQELKGMTGVEIAQAGGRMVKNGFKPGDARKDGNAVWAMEFSKDGKYLAAGGQDYTVRVWAVISTTEERRAHETEEDADGKDGSVRLSAPVFNRMPVQEYAGHAASILDISWSKNNFLLSSSMDKTVRLWHISRNECLCCFQHQDFVTSIRFHPCDDRFFLAGSLDSKLRLWSIPDKSIAFWSQLPDLITAVAFSPDGKIAIAGCLKGQCLLYETEGLKYQSQMQVRSNHGKNAKGSKITGIQSMMYPPDQPNGEVKLLITSNDSRVRVYNLRDKALEMKLRGNENSCSQIHASFSEDGRFVICGSEDRKVYIWSTAPSETDKDKKPMEYFEAHSAIVTTAIMAPTKTRQLLSTSGDPIYDLCNPPPVTLVSRADSHSSRPATEDGTRVETSVPPTPAIGESIPTVKPEASPAYIARSAHPDGNIVVTADYVGRIKVFRQDCAYQKRSRNYDANFSKKMLGHRNSVAVRNAKTSHRNSLTAENHPSSDRILSWRQSISSNDGGHNNTQHSPRPTSPPKSLSQALQSSPNPNRSPKSSNRLQSSSNTPPSISAPSGSRSSYDSKIAPHLPPPTTTTGNEPENRKPFSALQSPNLDTDPLMLQGDQSYMFWNKQPYQSQVLSSSSMTNDTQSQSRRGRRRLKPGSAGGSTSSHSGASANANYLEVPATRESTAISALSSEAGSEEADDHGAEEGDAVRCRRCDGRTFRARGIKGQTRLECLVCGEVV